MNRCLKSGNTIRNREINLTEGNWGNQISYKKRKTRCDFCYAWFTRHCNLHTVKISDWNRTRANGTITYDTIFLDLSYNEQLVEILFFRKDYEYYTQKCSPTIKGKIFGSNVNYCILLVDADNLDNWFKDWCVTMYIIISKNKSCSTKFGCSCVFCIKEIILFSLLERSSETASDVWLILCFHHHRIVLLKMLFLSRSKIQAGDPDIRFLRRYM